MSSPKSIFLLMLITIMAITILPPDVQSARTSKINDSKLCPGSSPVTKPAAPCNIQCFRADPVCGANGVTYTCGCAEAHCNGVRVVKLGPC
ncbi:hypothetical protein DCAR_0933504 [Daucus carota subsp. sativus]|uniref:Kazal-like domain-containing protein n=1 Tax=Daucus carota subsp. sativus TaxID=79200 RepID=A0AAF0XW91_DAUCS|nr:hypothetical protein DCAR_0933504 [Daucus carota subsp. sativus]